MNHQTYSENNPHEGLLTSGSTHSYWIDSVEPLLFTPLHENITTQVVVIGGGISGLSIAYCLAKKGKQVVLIEDGYIGSGETGRTTAHLVNALDDRYSEIESRLGQDTSRLAAESHTQAINFIESVIQLEKIDCEFRRINGYLFLHPSDTIRTLDDEFAATNRAGIKTNFVSEMPGMQNAKGPFLKFTDQAQFHPLKYLHGLAQAFIQYGGTIYTETRAGKISEKEVVANKNIIRCEQVVVATNTPVNDLVTMHTKQHPYRTYVIGALVPKGSIEPALWWDTGNMNSKWVADPYHYVRLQYYNEEFDMVISGGEDHKTGQAGDENIPEENRFKKLIDWTTKKFPAIEKIVYKWSGQVLEPVDSLAYIGRNPGDKNIYIVTGDSGNGMTHSAIAGMLISDLIMGLENPWEKIYEPSRITLKATGDFLKEVGNATVQYLDYLAPGDVKSINELAPNQGAIISMGLKKAAVYKDDKDIVHAFSAVCPHLGCIIQWNASEKSFDCPCHGSRFTCQGKLVNGPANTDLKKIDMN